MVLNPLCEQPHAPAVRGRNGARKLFSTKMLLIMNLTAVFLLFICITAGAHGFSQISISEKNTTLPKVFKELKKQSGFDFVYPVVLVERAGTLSVELKDVTLEEALTECLKGKGLAYSIVGKTVIIRQKEELQTTEQPVEQKATIDVSGRVTDADGNPLAGASVKVKGTTVGAITNANGEYVLKGIDENAVLVFSYAEHETEELKVKSRSNVTVALTRTEAELKEVVINKGYYTEKQRLSTGNVSKITAKEIERQPVNNVLLALAGKVPGLFITQSNGIPGSGVTVRIQGQNSLSRGSEPLYVIDGVPYTQQLMPNLSGNVGILRNYGSPLSFINPSDIESIEVLKDADATSIYGSRAAAGAILITTKKGKPGKTKVDINVQTGFGKVTRFLPLLNTEQYLEMRREAFANDGLPVPNFATDPNDVNYDVNGVWSQTKNTDWQRVLLGGTSKYSDVNASISGGNANTTFLVGSGYHKETTVFPGDLSDEKGSFHLNINNTSTNQKFRTQVTASYLVDNNSLIANDLTSQAIKLSPNAPDLYNSDGSLNWAPSPNGNSTWFNPLAFLNRQYSNKTKNLIGNVTIGYQLAKGLHVKSSFGYNSLHTDEFMLFPSIAHAPENRQLNLGLSQFANGNITSWIIEPQASYTKSIGKGVFDVLLGSTILKEARNNERLSGYDYVNDLLLTDIRSAGTVGIDGTIASVYRYSALFGRLNYNYKDRYIINLTGRRDGSSRFGSENLFHNFYSVSGAWIFSNESFLQDNISVLSFGKIKASFGTTGNDQIGDYQFLNLYNSISVAQLYGGATGLVPSSALPNPYLQWEETKKLNLGLDLGFFRDKVLLTANYYLNRSSNQLQRYALPFITGRSNIQRNIPATIQNKGWEIFLSATIIQTKNFNWTSRVNLTIPKNKLVAYPGLEQSTLANILVVGQPFTISKFYHYIKVDPTTGLYLLNDHKGAPVSTGLIDSALSSIIDNSPKYYGGFENTFQFKGFELSVLFQFTKQVKGNYFFGDYPGMFYSGSGDFMFTNNQPIWVLDRWQKPGDNAAIQKLSTAYPSVINDPYSYVTLSSDARYKDASYIRLRNISLSWQIPQSWKQKAWLQDARIYVQGQNLLTITNYKGMDPETGFTALPPLRIVTAGIKITL